MIVARMGEEGAPDSLLVLLEPGNLAKLQLGQAITKDMSEFLPGVTPGTNLVIGFCPDVQFVADRVKAGDSFFEALKASMDRPEVFLRPDHAEDIIQLPLKEGNHA